MVVWPHRKETKEHAEVVVSIIPDQMTIAWTMLLTMIIMKPVRDFVVSNEFYLQCTIA
jgi:hypothetical protein